MPNISLDVSMLNFSKVARVRIRRWHRWLGMVVGVQLSFWVISGVYFAWVPLDKVRGRDQTVSPQKYQLSAANQYQSPGDILRTYGETYAIGEIRLTQDGDTPIYLILNDTREPVLKIHAVSGIALSPITRDQAIALAAKDYGATFELHDIQYINEKPPEDYRGSLPVFRVAVADSRRTNLYIHPVNGQIIARRNAYWRWYDRLWMLHILDFKERENFNNPLLRIVVLGGLGLVVSGYLLLWTSRRVRS